MWQVWKQAWCLKYSRRKQTIEGCNYLIGRSGSAWGWVNKKDNLIFLVLAVDLNLSRLFFHFYICHLQHFVVMSSTVLITHHVETCFCFSSRNFLTWFPSPRITVNSWFYRTLLYPFPLIWQLFSQAGDSWSVQSLIFGSILWFSRIQQSGISLVTAIVLLEIMKEMTYQTISSVFTVKSFPVAHK